MKDGDKPIPGIERYSDNRGLRELFEGRFQSAEERVGSAVRGMFTSAGLQIPPFVNEALSGIAESYGHLITEKTRQEQIKREQAEELRISRVVTRLQERTTTEDRQAVRGMSLKIIRATSGIIRDHDWNPYAEDWNLAQRVFEDPIIETAAKTGVLIGRDSSTMGKFTFDFDRLPDLFSDEPPKQDAQYFRRLDGFTFDFADDLGFGSFSNAPHDQDWSEGTTAGWDVVSGQMASSIVYKVMLPSRISHHPTKPFLAVASPKIRGSGFDIDIAHSRLDIYLKQGSQFGA